VKRNTAEQKARLQISAFVEVSIVFVVYNRLELRRRRDSLTRLILNNYSFAQLGGEDRGAGNPTIMREGPSRTGSVSGCG